MSFTSESRSSPYDGSTGIMDDPYVGQQLLFPNFAGARVLIVDDELPIVESVAYNLRKEGYRTLTACDADQCMEIVRDDKPELIILDVMLPSVSGFDLCRIIRKRSEVPIIMLTARADETDRVVGLEVGADDYLTKPFSMRELLARVRTILRRSAPPEEPMTRPVQVGHLIIDPIRYEVTVSGNPVDLSHRAFQLLLFLASNPGRVFTRQTLLERVWGRDNIVEERTVDVHVRWIREKIETDPAHPRYLVTIRGVGYKLSSNLP